MTPHRTIPVPSLRFDDLLRRVERAEGFAPLVAALKAGRSGSIDGTTEGATAEASDGSDSNSVWYRWTAPANGTFVFSAPALQALARKTAWSQESPELRSHDQPAVRAAESGLC